MVISLAVSFQLKKSNHQQEIQFKIMFNMTRS